MKRQPVLIAVFLCSFALVTPAANAQSTTGTIDGVVRDVDGMPLPGVTVVANSPALIRADMTVVSNADGYFRLNLLPPGVYTVEFRLGGFRTETQAGIVVLVNQTTPMQLGLELAGVAETEVVTAVAPNIDPRAARLAFNYSGELVQNIPTARNMDDLFSTIPGVESVNNLGGGIQPGTAEVQNVLGAGERAGTYLLDGSDTTDSAGRWNTQSLMTYDNVEEIQVIKAAKPAEIPFQGGLFNVITKSGGNEFSGQIGGYFSDQALQSTNVDTGGNPELSNELLHEYEVTASLGGRIVRDKLWWYASGRMFDGVSRVFGFPADVSEDVLSGSGKLTWQPSQDHRIVGNVSLWDQEVSHFFFGYSPALALDEEASSFRPRSGQTYGAKWSGVFSDNLVAEADVSYSHHNYNQELQPGADVAIVDLGTGLRSRSPGTSAGSVRFQDTTNWRFAGDLSWFVPDAAGTHDVKFGVEYAPTTLDQIFDEPGDHQLHTLFGRKFAVRFISTPSAALYDNDNLSLYAQDAWSVSDRLTLNLGLRFMSQRASTPPTTGGGGQFAGTSLAQRFPELNATELPASDLSSFDTLEPRFAATYQIDRLGRTVARFGASRYYQPIATFDFFVLNPAFPVTWVTLWFDRNNDSAYQLGEEGPLLFSFGGQLNSVDPNLKRPYTDELVFGVSHEPFRDFQVSANAIFRRDNDLFATVDTGVPFDSYTPVDVLDPGPDGVAGTGDDATLTVFAQDPDTIGDSRLQLTNPDGNKRWYKGLELTASKRFSNRWQMVGSLVLSEMKVIRPTVALTSTGLYDTPNGLINAEGLDGANQTWQVKFQGTYRFDFGLGVSGLFRYRSGNPYTRELVVEGLPQGPFNVLAETRGASRTDGLSSLDLRLEQEFGVGAARLGVMLDAFNLFNSAASVDEGIITGVDYGRARSVQAPRLMRLGVRYIW